MEQFLRSHWLITRLDRLVDAINKEMLSAALISDSEGLLDNYGRILVKKLREIGNLEVEVYYPNSTEALLNRFNKILEDISIDSAVTSKKSTAPHKVLRLISLQLILLKYYYEYNNTYTSTKKRSQQI